MCVYVCLLDDSRIRCSYRLTVKHTCNGYWKFEFIAITIQGHLKVNSLQMKRCKIHCGCSIITCRISKIVARKA